MNSRRFTLALLILILLLPLPAAAQEPVTLRLDAVAGDLHPEMAVFATVRDEFGVSIPGLGPQNFTIREDFAAQPVEISAVSTLINDAVELSVVLAVDVSGSMQGAKLRDAQEAARRFLDGLNAQDEVALIAFAGAIALDSVDAAREFEFGVERAAMYEIIDGLIANGATPLHDAAFKAVQWAAAQPPGNRAVVLFTDGREEKTADGKGGSRIANEDSPIREANRSGIPVFTIGLGDDVDESYLQRLALETGGTYQHAQRSAELADLFANVSALLKQQYRIDYASALPADGDMHRLRLEVEVGQHRAFAEVAFGPLPFVPTPTPANQPTATPTPTATPLPTATPTPAPTATPEPSPPPTLVLASAATPAPPARGGFLGIPLLDWGGVLAALLLLGGGGMWLARRRPGPATTHHCLQCGHALPAADAPCPSCGYRGSFSERR